MAVLPRIVGRRSWTRDEDNEGYVSYQLVVRVQVASFLDGPERALQTPGLPVYGNVWNYGNDFNPWATCRHDKNVKEVVEQDNQFYDITYNFRVKPDGKNCYEQSITDPLLQPMKQSGSFQRDKEQGLVDRFGRRVLTSSWEVIYGPQNEWETDRPQVVIQQFTPQLGVEQFTAFMDCLNDRPLWGLPRRCWKLSATPWEVLYRGTCEKYYTRTFTFDGNRKTWDRDIQDEGTKCLRGHWHPKVDVWVLDRLPEGCAGAGQLPSKWNPSHFIRAVDRNGNHLKVVLDGNGRPVTTDNWSVTFQGSAAQAQSEADAMGGTKSGPFHTEGLAQQACCIAITSGTGTHTVGTNPQVYICLASNTGHPPSDLDFWVPIAGQSPVVNEWDQNHFYSRGDTVFISVNTYIAKADNIGVDPSQDTSEETWTSTDALTFKGTWVTGGTYGVGDYVEGQAVPGGSAGTGTSSHEWWCLHGLATQPGNVHVEYYREANLLLLGIPALLG